MAHNLIRKSLTLLVLTLAICLAATIEVGGGAPTAGLSGRFVNAFFRNGFAYLVTLPPTDNVQRFGATGLIQQFNALAGGGKLALIKSNTSTALPTDGSVDVAQVLANMNAYYSSIGVTTAGFPTTDTLPCPPQAPLPSCQYQFFNKNYLLFTYDSSTFNGSTFAVRDPFFTRWLAAGGITGLGPAIDIERKITGQKNVAATVQLYAGGAIYSVNSGSLVGSAFSVAAPVYAAFVAAGGDSGFLGLPTSGDLQLTGGGHRQTFQGGNLDYTYTGDQASTPMLELPVASVSIQPAFNSAYQMKQGDTLPLHANLFTSNGASLAGRLVSWVSTNSRVVSIGASSGSPDALATAVGPGTALVSAISEGIASGALTIAVNSICCQIGEGAPPVAQQAMAAAVARNQLAIQAPVQAPASRAGAGFAQQLSSTGGITYLLAKADASPTAFLVTGPALVRYNQLGGPAGSLGYPTSDGTGSGHQLFTGGALAASPARLVTGVILAKWTALSFEAGPAGLPTADATPLLAATGSKAQQQPFAKGVIVAATSGPRAGQAQFLSGLILSRYTALGGASSPFGLPVSDAFGLDGRIHQDFEGGYIDYALGDAAALEHAAARRPSIGATPSTTVVAGSRVRLSVSGFPDGSALQVSISGQPDFTVTTVNGSYTWDAFVPLAAPSQTVAIHAVDTGSGVSADGSYTVKSLSESPLKLVVTQGDSQSGAPGALLAQTLRVQLTDAGGVPVVGVPVTFAASTGGQIASSAAVTDDSGQAEASARLPFSEGLALFTATAARLVTTFSAKAAATTLTKFPAFQQSDPAFASAALGKGPATIAQKGALLTAAAGILGYYVNRGDLPGAPVDPGALNQYLQTLCGAGPDGSQLCDGFLSTPDTSEQVVNLWRIGGMVGGKLDVAVVSPDPQVVRDLVSQGSPVLLALALTANGAPAGGHYVVATGVAPDGGILIRDPNPDFGRAALNDYLAAFSAGGYTWQATLSGAVRFIPRAPAPGGFLISVISQPLASQFTMDIASAAGGCGLPVDFGDAALPAAPAAPLVSRLRYCDGAQPVYQLSLGESQAWRAAVTDLAPGGRRADLIGGSVIAYKVTRSASHLMLSPQDVSIGVNGVVNGATLLPGIAPGGLAAILGSGLAGPAGDTAVQINGETAAVQSQSPFQVTVQVPPDQSPGPATLTLQSPYGSGSQAIQLFATAPAIFLAPGSKAADATPYGVVVNADATLNSPVNPALRGQLLTISATGLGAFDGGTPASATTPVAVVLNGIPIDADFAGPVDGVNGVYQVTLLVPLDAPPGIDVPLFIRQPDGDSNTVFVAIQ